MKAITTVEEFEQSKQDHDELVVLVSATWCAPCKMLKPVYEEVSSERTTELLAVDADDGQDIAIDLRVRGVPTMVFFKGGEEVHRHTGVMSKDNLNELIDKTFI